MHFRRLRVGGLTIVAFATLTLSDTRPAAQQPSVIRGRVGIGVPVTARRPTAEYSRSVSLAELAPVSELRHVVVYLRDAPRAGVPAPVRAEIRQRNEHFVPRVVAVPVGSEVEFPNDDGFYHNVFSLSRVKSFNLGRYPQGASRRVRFDKPGVVKVFCEIHSHMTATVMVFDHPWYTIPNDDGTFMLPGVPAGERQVTAWHERLGDTTRRVRAEPGRPAAADFILPVPRQ